MSGDLLKEVIYKRERKIVCLYNTREMGITAKFCEEAENE